MRKLIYAVMAAVVFMQGCGMLIHGEMQDLSIRTDPPGAIARVSNAQCLTPCTMQVRRAADTIYFTKGDLKDEFLLNKSFNVGASVFGNLLWIAPGLVIDLLGGGAYTIQPVDVKLGEDMPKKP